MTLEALTKKVEDIEKKVKPTPGAPHLEPFIHLEQSTADFVKASDVSKSYANWVQGNKGEQDVAALFLSLKDLFFGITLSNQYHENMKARYGDIFPDNPVIGMDFKDIVKKVISSLELNQVINLQQLDLHIKSHVQNNAEIYQEFVKNVDRDVTKHIYQVNEAKLTEEQLKAIGSGLKLDNLEVGKKAIDAALRDFKQKAELSLEGYHSLLEDDYNHFMKSFQSMIDKTMIEFAAVIKTNTEEVAQASAHALQEISEQTANLDGIKKIEENQSVSLESFDKLVSKYDKLANELAELKESLGEPSTQDEFMDDEGGLPDEGI